MREFHSRNLNISTHNTNFLYIQASFQYLQHLHINKANLDLETIDTLKMVSTSYPMMYSTVRDDHREWTTFHRLKISLSLTE